MKLKSIFFSGLAASLFVGAPASAAVIGIASDCGIGGTGTGLSGVSFTCGTASRSDTSKINIFENAPAVGDDQFFSLGLGGSLVIQFDPKFKGNTSVVEITNGGVSSSHDEKVEIFGSNDGNIFTSLGFADNQSGINDGTRGTKTTISFAGTYAYLGFLDISKAAFPNTGSTDGFDIDAISVSSVPLPASALLLMAGVAGLGAMRKRRAS